MSSAPAGESGAALDVVLFITQYGTGGVERMMVQTAGALAGQGLRTGLVLASSEGAYLDALPEPVERIVLSDRDPTPPLAELLASRRPAAAISAKLVDDRILADARDQSGSPTHIYFRVGNPLGHRLRARGIGPVGRFLKLRRMRALYRRADGFIAVSEGIRSDLEQWLQVTPDRIHVLPNPTIAPELYDRAAEDPGHQWLVAGQPPVVLGVGALRQQKDFATLIRAFARVRATRACRLIILGEGRQRSRLEKLASRLGIADDVDLPGWRPNPHAYVARAAVFALSSRWEGTANVIIEAAALGTPIVATDCRYGPREVLRDGQYGELVSPRDPNQLAGAILRVLEQPPDRSHVGRAAEPYLMAESARQYVDALRLSNDDS